MKFDMDVAWKDTIAQLRGNLGLLAILAGVFFFLPYAILTVALPDMAAVLEPAAAAGNNEAMANAVLEFYRQYWWALLLLVLIQALGMLAILALLKRRAKPTVAEALRNGGRALPSYLAVQILQSLAFIVIAGLLIGLAAAAGLPALAFVMGLIAVLLLLYITVKLCMVAPILAQGETLNPFAAIGRSWRLTKGNSVRLFLFFVLILVAFLVISAIVTIALGLLFALGGEQVALFGNALVAAAVNAVFLVVIVAILAAIHLQLARLRGDVSVPAAGHEIES